MKLEIKTSNAAFDGEDKAYEVARLLRIVADALEEGYTGDVLVDYNGNKVGEWKL